MSDEPTELIANLHLWSDEPAEADLLSFSEIADTAVDALFDEGLDPVALGISGSWGSGKTTILNLVEQRVEERALEAESTVLVVRADPWRYDPAIGPKESLISDVLRALSDELREQDQVGSAAFEAVKKLAKRINWAKAIKMTATTALTLQLPHLDDVMGLVSDEPDTLDSDKGMASFRQEFEDLLKQPALAHVSGVVVLVDDLDRCLPDTVVETFEAIRLFLSAKRMSFVIAADEKRVAEAIQQKLQSPPGSEEGESVAELYLHKIVQTTIPVPTLSAFDTGAYLFLLMVDGVVIGNDYDALVRDVTALRRGTANLDDLKLPTTPDLSLLMATAVRLTPIIYEKFHGNPRRIKRFLNDVAVRQSVARRRGITLDSDAIGKLMVLERLLPKDFDQFLDWLAKGELGSKLDALQHLADGTRGSEQSEKESGQVKTPASADDFSGGMVRWAKLTPRLEASDVTGYLTLAAAFKGRVLLDETLAERLRDIAAALTATSQIERDAVTDDDLRRLPPGDVAELLEYLGRRLRSDPAIQLPTANSVIQLAKLHPAELTEAKVALTRLPSPEVEASTVLLFSSIAADYRDVLEVWAANPNVQAGRAIARIRRK